ncbi:MAG: hypothetical protein OXC37_06165, partial [Bdellovibrionaceae bacterium]|nr:hypothetical protein [Pseudobdellovibrionaceae bacterium]
SILTEYQEEPDKWGSPFNYLFLNYAVRGPSTITKREYTSYIPLVKLDDETSQAEAIMIDIVNITQNPKDQNTFTIVRASHVLYILNFNEKNKMLFGVDSVCYENILFNTNKAVTILKIREGYIDCNW